MVYCWWCRHDVGNSIIHVPTGVIKHSRYKEVTSSRYAQLHPTEQKKVDFVVDYVKTPTFDKTKDTLGVEGHFCSFECGRAYLISEHSHNYEGKLHIFSSMRRQALKANGTEYKDIPLFKSAPSWKSLQEFGGSLSIDEFRSDKEEWVVQPKNYIHNPVVTVKKHIPISKNTSWSDKKKLITEVSKSTEQLKIKRSKPRTIVSGFSDIGSKLGIKVVVKD